MTVAPAHTSTKFRALPAGVGGSLWSARPQYGVFDFHGARLRIEVSDPKQVLFPTDCGLSLLAALRSASGPELAGRSVLDIGCGSGIYTVALLSAGARHVTALDINPSAVEVTRANVVNNGLDRSRLSCVSTDLAGYRPAQRFDLVLSNPPHLPHYPNCSGPGGLAAALIAGEDGRMLYDLILRRIDDLLAPGGTLLMAHSSLTDVPRTTEELEARGYTARTLEVFEMDIPLLVYAEHKDTMLARLARLRDAGRAAFTGERFTVHVMAYQGPS